MLATVYRNEALPCMCALKCFKIFREGEDLENDPRSGQPSTAQNAKVSVLVAGDH
jgi:hypothetical protein